MQVLLRRAVSPSTFLVFAASAQDRLLLPEAQTDSSSKACKELVEARGRQRARMAAFKSQQTRSIGRYDNPFLYGTKWSETLMQVMC